MVDELMWKKVDSVAYKTTNILCVFCFNCSQWVEPEVRRMCFNSDPSGYQKSMSPASSEELSLVASLLVSQTSRMFIKNWYLQEVIMKSK